MKIVVRHIDRSLKALYNLESKFRAESFLVRRPTLRRLAGNAGMQGALYVQSADPESLAVGIYLNEAVRAQLSSLPSDRSAFWPYEKFGAFTVATEEISHFHYLLHHANGGRQVSQLELELQGEIDKFLLAYFANAGSDPGDAQVFEMLFDRLFTHFHLADRLSTEERDRYTEANRLAKRFILKISGSLVDKEAYEKVFRTLRRFYRLGVAEKISFIG